MIKKRGYSWWVVVYTGRDPLTGKKRQKRSWSAGRSRASRGSCGTRIGPRTAPSAALPVALLGALELLMSVARTGLPHTHRTPAAEDRSTDRDLTATAVVRPQLPAPDHRTTAGNGSGPQRDSRSRVRELVAHERATGTRLHARDVATAAGISERRAYELLRAARTEDTEEPAP